MNNKKNQKKAIKICFAASSGGHLEQLLMLKPLMSKYESILVTEKTPYLEDMKIDSKLYTVPQVNRRELTALFKLIIITIKSLKIFLKEKPDVVVCTGVLAMIPICLYSKLFGKELIYIESFAKMKSPTLTGKFLYPFADRFYVQWENMKNFYPNAIYMGGIY